MSAENPEGAAPEPGFSFTDKRRIDPETGEVREAGAEPAPGQPAPGQPAAGDAAPAEPGMDVPDDLSGLADAGEAPAEGAPGAPAADEAPLSPDAQLAAERLDDLQRINAEYAAFRQRAQREQDRARDAGAQSVVEALIPVLDEVRLASENGDVTGPFEVHTQKLIASLEKIGVQQFGEVGEEFDPNIHEALMQQENGEVEVPTVFLVMQPGYRIGERIIRAARVGVHSPAE